MSALLETGGSPLQFIAALLCVWIAVCYAISYCGGWWALSRGYPSKAGEIRKRWSFQSGMMRRMTGYGGCLNFGATDRELTLSVLFLFRPGHPPLQIPWEDIEMTRYKPWMMTSRIRLSFRKAPDVPLIIRNGLAREISKENTGRWNGIFV